MRRNDRRAAAAAKRVAPAPVYHGDKSEGCCEHGIPFEDDCLECEAEVMDLLGSMDGEPAERRTTNG